MIAVLRQHFRCFNRRKVCKGVKKERRKQDPVEENTQAAKELVEVIKQATINGDSLWLRKPNTEDATNGSNCDCIPDNNR